jgi:hypothetical protein
VAAGQVESGPHGTQQTYYGQGLQPTGSVLELSCFLPKFCKSPFMQKIERNYEKIVRLVSRFRKEVYRFSSIGKKSPAIILKTTVNLVHLGKLIVTSSNIDLSLQYCSLA